jgi:hypothetical protein
MDVELLSAADCPNAPAARTLLAECLAALGLAMPVREQVGDFASPTILVDGVDVMTGSVGPPSMRACRLDLPTATRLQAALRGQRPTSTMDSAA